MLAVPSNLLQTSQRRTTPDQANRPTQSDPIRPGRHFASPSGRRDRRFESGLPDQGRGGARRRRRTPSNQPSNQPARWPLLTALRDTAGYAFDVLVFVVLALFIGAAVFAGPDRGGAPATDVEPPTTAPTWVVRDDPLPADPFPDGEPFPGDAPVRLTPAETGNR